MPLVAPYVASEPDGIVPVPEGDFKQGPSWYLYPMITE